MAKRTDHQIAVDDALTKHLNQHDAIHTFLAECTAKLHLRFSTDERVFFYLKGSAALARYLRRHGVPEQMVNEICARSDWDTQLVINPLLPRAEWFAAFKDCQRVLRESLDEFEEQLLAVLVQVFPQVLGQAQVDGRLLGGKSADQDVRRGQNELAKRLRETLAEYFAGIFLDVVQHERFAEQGAQHWNLDWNNIQRIASPGRRKGILEMDLQANGQATLTSALIHPGQALDNLNSIMTGDEVRLLVDSTRRAADAAWARMSELVERYDQRAAEYTDGGQHPPTEQQAQALQALQERIDEALERYEEVPDPEDVAEAEKRETESLAPYTLVALEKGARKVGSILENMTIRDFYLFRLMIKAQISNRDPQNRLVPDAPQDTDYDSFKQQFKFRAELLDVSIPRDDSLETAEQWAHTRRQIAVYDHIPLPNGEYFLDEYVLMFREVLDKKSSSAHKLTKRLKRACLIAQCRGVELGQEGLTERAFALAQVSPTFSHLLNGRQPDVANGVLFLRMFEQITESYGLRHDEKLAHDAHLLILRWFEQDLVRILTSPLTHETFLELMRIYARIGNILDGQTFALGRHRQQVLGPDKLLAKAKEVVSALHNAFRQYPGRVRCAVVDDFAIADYPGLPDEVRRMLPLNVCKIVVHATPQSRQAVGQVIEQQVQGILDLAPGTDMRTEGDIRLFRVVQHSDNIGEQHREGIPTVAGRAVFMKIEVVTEPGVEWVVPAHQYDLRNIVKQYRRSLPQYTEYQALARRKGVLRELERLLTTF